MIDKILCKPMRMTIVFLALLLTSCQRDEPAVSPSKPRASVTLRLLIVNDGPLAAAIDRLQGEWAERDGGRLLPATVSWEEVLEGKSLDADVLVFATRHLGQLCERDWLRPVRRRVLEGPLYEEADLFPVVRQRLISYGGTVMALPLGVQLATDFTKEQTGLALLARAAPYAVHPQRETVLWDLKTMRPRIAEPPLVRALTELCQDKRAQSDTFYDPIAGQWETAHENRHVPVWGSGGRLVGVTTSSRNAARAFRLVEWLTSAEISSQIGPTSNHLLPCRRSLLTTADGWFHENLKVALESKTYLVVPRIPGVDEYLAALDRAVERAVRNKVDPAESLHQAAQKWEAITDQYGRETQRKAYLRHLGLEVN